MTGLSRTDAIRAIAGELGNDVSVSGLGYASWCLGTVCDRTQNFYMRGAMGSATPVGFGLARAQPDRRIVVFEGDGSVLMNLGALTTIGAYAPKNLIVVIWDDQRYETTGGQETHTARGADLAAIARGAGIRSVASVSDAAGFLAAYQKAKNTPGPHVVVAAIVPEATPPLRRSLPPAINLHNVMQELGTCSCHARPAT
jgi:thiamine pyrophosphate-dependent acetolactate synthase large subunit-like protein